jgi:hypothetical protein
MGGNTFKSWTMSNFLSKASFVMIMSTFLRTVQKTNNNRRLYEKKTIGRFAICKKERKYEEIQWEILKSFKSQKNPKCSV